MRNRLAWAAAGLAAMSLCSNLVPAARAAEKTEDDVRMLLPLLDLDRAGLEKVKAAQADPAAAGKELLAYYRARTSVKHPVDRAGLAALRGKPLDKGTLQTADDALRHVFRPDPHYPPFDFGPDIDWHSNRGPNQDWEWLWQLHRHHYWDALAAAYRHTGEEKYAEGYVSQLLDWIAKCPLEKESDAWRTIEAGIRGHSWTRHFQYFLDSPAYTPEVLARHLLCFHQHAEYLTDRKMSGSNWGLMESEGAAFIAMIFPEFKDAPTWRARAFEYLNAKMQTQVRPDGHQKEQCLGYHLGSISWFSRTAELAGTNGLASEFPAEYWKGLERMCEVPLAYGLPDGSNTQFGDDHSPLNWRGAIRKWADVFHRQDLLYAATGGKQGKAPAETAFALKDSGFYSVRSAWDPGATMLVLKCGPDGGWHDQWDNGTFELYVAGRRLMPDSGCYIYNGNEQAKRDRAWFKQSRVHQTLTLDNADTAKAPQLLAWAPGPDMDTLVVENQSYTNLVHRRAVLFVEKTFFVLVDEALGPAAGAVDLHFQLAPGEAVFDAAAPSARTVFTNGPNVLIRGLAQPGMTLEKEEGQVSFVYAKKEPRPAFCFRLGKPAGTPGVRFVTLVIPYVGSVPEAGIELLGKPEAGARKIELAVTFNGKRRPIGYEF